MAEILTVIVRDERSGMPVFALDRMPGKFFSLSRPD
jgi:hypothetical protein